MNEATSEWLEPMFLAAAKDDVKVVDLIRQASVPLTEAVLPTDASGFVQTVTGEDAADAPVHERAIDWNQFGLLLRRRLGWDNIYPGPPPGG